MNVERNYYVYYLKHRETGTIFYVGSSRLKPKQRYGQHKSLACKGKSYPVCKYFRQILNRGEHVDLVVQIDQLTKEEARETENDLIVAHGRDNLTNATWSYGKAKRKARYEFRKQQERVRANSNRNHAGTTVERISQNGHSNLA